MFKNLTSALKRRRIFIINRRFQLTFIAYFMILAMGACAVFGMISRSFLVKLMEQGKLVLGLPENHSFFQFISEMQNTMDSVFIATALIVFALLVVGGIILSHRVAGPLYRLNFYLHLLAEHDPSNLKDISFREKDFFPELAEAYNLALKRLKEQQKH